MKIGITGCRVLLNNEVLISGSIVIDLELGRIELVKEGSISRRDIDLLVKLTREYIALPSFVDMHVHCRDLDLAYKETIETCSESAAVGGVAVIFDMPNTRPPLNTPERIEKRLRDAAARSKVEYRLHAGVPEDPDLIDEYYRIGVRSVKMYPEDYERLVERQLLEKFLQKLRQCDMLLIAHCEDLHIVQRQVSTLEHVFSNHNKIRPEEAEIIAVKSLLKHCYRSGVRRLHITHVSSPRTVKLILEAKSLIPELTFDVTPHHLFLCQEECLEKFRDIPGLCKVNPPLRDSKTRDELFTYLVEGSIDCVASDHAPHTLQEKLMPYDQCPPGFPGLETTSVLLLNLWRREILTLHDVVWLYSTRPSRICRVNMPVIAQDTPAYLTVIKVGEQYRISGSNFKSKAKFTPFEGLKVDVKVSLTIVRNRIAYVDSSDVRLQELLDIVKLA